MPELPEVETLRRDLADRVAGARVVGVEVRHPRAVRRHPPGRIGRVMRGRTLGPVDRIGKYLLVGAEASDVLVVHLRMSGQLLVVPGSAPAGPHTHAVLRLADGRELRFVDPRTFGELFVTRRPSPSERPPELAALGPDALDDLPHAVDLARLVRPRRRRLKDLLVDQRVMAGLGNIYADEILHAAGLRPTRAGASLSAAEVDHLHAALRRTLLAAIRARGSTLRDGQYVDAAGHVGGYQRRHQVYGRAGEPCLRCGAPLQRERWGGRTTVWCPSCQR